MNNSKWTHIGEEAAKEHSIYGIGGWLLFFAIVGLIGFLFNLGSLIIYDDAVISISYFNGSLHLLPRIYYEASFFASILKLSIIYWMMWVKHPKFRTYATIMAIFEVPILSMFLFFNDFNVFVILGNSFITLPSIILWVTYLQRSKRVRVTFEHSIRST